MTEQRSPGAFDYDWLYATLSGEPWLKGFDEIGNLTWHQVYLLLYMPRDEKGNVTRAPSKEDIADPVGDAVEEYRRAGYPEWWARQLAKQEMDSLIEENKRYLAQMLNKIEG